MPTTQAYEPRTVPTALHRAIPGHWPPRSIGGNRRPSGSPHEGEAITNRGEGNAFLRILRCNFASCGNFETDALLNFTS